MDIFEGRYFNINRTYLTLIGQWPMAERATRQIIIRIVFMTSIVIFTMPHIISALLYYKDIDRLMLNLLCIAIAITVLLKNAGVTAAGNDMKNVCIGIADNWLSIRDESERRILIEYSQRGREVTIFYDIFLSISCMFVALIPCIPKILDLVNPLTQPRPNMHLLEGEFFVDRESNFFKLLCCDVALVFVCYLTTTAVDTMYVACTQHCCALYAIIRYRLRNLKQAMVDESPSSIEDHFYRDLVHAIELHKNALNFTSTLNDTYSTTFLMILMVNIGIVPLDACAIIARLEEPLSLIPYVSVFGIVVLHLFVVNFAGQRVLDHGIDLTDAAYFSEWYAAPVRARKVLFIFMLRCTQPESLSAGGLLLMNLETFSMIVRTAVSYITVLASFR